MIGANGYSPGQEHVLAPNLGEPVRLRGASSSGEIELDLLTRIWYRVAPAEGERGPWRVETTGYSHRIETTDAWEIIAYHWHPKGSKTPYPHLHIGAGIGSSPGLLDKKHIPTGRIPFEDIIKFAILEPGVEPKREDWREVLSETRAAFEERRTWR
ncbi:MAG: hypothetical protein H0U65_16060 [Rubrobacter sp.]|nr:hypothetical protein [Rubrobacter sp.]